MDRDTLLQLAEHAKLELTEAEIPRLCAEMSRLLEHLEALARVDTAGVEPSPYPAPLALVTRGDTPGAPLDRERLLAAAPERRAAQFRVPRVIEA